MKKLLSGIFMLLFIFSVAAVYAQKCGTTLHSQYQIREQMFENRAKREAALQNGIANPRGNETQYVPVKFHLVGLSDGTLIINESQILNMICELNNSYADQDIVFYIKHPYNYIHNTSLFNNPDIFENPAAEFQILNNKVNDAVNVFITGSTGGPNTLGFYQPPYPNYDYIVIRKSSVVGNTAAHEMGHFFSLAHPFFGWENNAWDEAVHGLQVGPNSPSEGLPIPVPNEKMDQSNCLAAADGICDTPSDYLFAFSDGQNGCNPWNGGALDPNGDVCDPMEVNMMSYFSQCGSYVFTEDQKTEIWSSLTESSQRAYIRHSYVPDTDPITEAPELVYPIDGETTPGYNKVEFNWDPVANATHYLLEIDFLPTFTGLPSRYVVANGTSKEVEGIFSASGNYYWRVRPYSDGYTCGTPFSVSGNFEAGNSVNTKEIEALDHWAVIPNPVSQGEQLTIQVEVSESFKAGISLYSVTGQQIQAVQNHLFTEGANAYELAIGDISPGIYVVAIHTDAGVANKKVVITK